MKPSRLVENQTVENQTENQTYEPVTLHRIMQTMIGERLKEHYKPPQELSHELLVRLMQLKKEERREALAGGALREGDSTMTDSSA